MNIFTSHLEKSRKDGELLGTQRGFPSLTPLGPGSAISLEDVLGGRQGLNPSSPQDPTALGCPRYKDSAPECGVKDEGHF